MLFRTTAWRNENVGRQVRWPLDFATACIEAELSKIVDAAAKPPCPPTLAEAMKYAVFPGGRRIRPALCVAVAAACGDDDLALAIRAAAAIELLHCASLAQDDLPCFDDAGMRRHKSCLHAAYGEATAILVADALILLSTKTVSEAPSTHCEQALTILATISDCAGPPSGCVAGQAWELESSADLLRYHRSKTSALFRAAAVCGAVASGGDAAEWGRFGERLGDIYQLTDDLIDVETSSAVAGKSTGRDRLLRRPSAVETFGVSQTERRASTLAAQTLASIPAVPKQTQFRAWLASVIDIILERGCPGDVRMVSR